MVNAQDAAQERYRAPQAGPIPGLVSNWIGGSQREAVSQDYFEKRNPATGKVLCRVARSRRADVELAVDAARRAQREWAKVPPVKRGELLYGLVARLEKERDQIAEIVALETGKSRVSARGETDGAIALGRFMAGEGQRLYGRSTTSGMPHRSAVTIREPVGVAGLIVAANTPIANVAWKAFPALICGNGVVLKAAEDTPATAWIFGAIAHEAGLPDGIFNVVQGFGEEAGGPLVEHPDVALISFTGSTEVGRRIAVACGRRLAKVSLELGGKNPFVVCDDADLAIATKWALLSAFSNAGQRCAAGSRIIVFDSVYNEFRDMLVRETRKLRIGVADADDFGPVINEQQLKNMLTALERATQNGAAILIGGHRLVDDAHRDGFYLAATLIEHKDATDELSSSELFGPIASLYRARDFAEALALANQSPYGLTACIHTRSIHRAMQFTREIEAGVAVVNAGTYGSEPHMPFGGIKQSGNGWREPGTEALDVYSELKDVYINFDPEKV